MKKADYLSFGAGDFIDDNDFVRFIKYKDAEDVVFWEEWLASQPENVAAYQQASLQLRLILSAGNYPEQTGFREEIFTAITNTIRQNQTNLKIRRKKYYWTISIAASLLLITYSTWFFSSIVTIKAAYGTQISYTLPDGSKIRLNANSVLRYPRSINWNKIRTVSLNGEAYFIVKHINRDKASIKNGDRFIVTSPHLRVEVLGTEFNLKDRRSRAEVMLVKGRVKVKSVQTGESHDMKPGNAVRWQSDQLQFKLQADSVEKTAWLDGKLQVNQTSAREIINEFEDLYGYQIVLQDSTKASKKIDGVISVKSEDAMLFVISHILNVNIKKEGKTIYLINNKN